MTKSRVIIKSVIVAAHVTRPSGSERDLAIETVMRLFGGMSTSRLNRTSASAVEFATKAKPAAATVPRITHHRNDG